MLEFNCVKGVELYCDNAEFSCADAEFNCVNAEFNLGDAEGTCGNGSVSRLSKSPRRLIIDWTTDPFFFRGFAVVARGPLSNCFGFDSALEIEGRWSLDLSRLDGRFLARPASGFLGALPQDLSRS